jgi:hypothetical protein
MFTRKSAPLPIIYFHSKLRDEIPVSKTWHREGQWIPEDMRAIQITNRGIRLDFIAIS